VRRYNSPHLLEHNKGFSMRMLNSILVSRRRKLFAMFGLALLTTACATKAPAPAASAVSATQSSDTNGAQVKEVTGFDKLFGFISPYRISIQQGNFISQEMVSQLKEGMTREQVRNVLGTALLTDMFHEDRWDYPFRMLKPNGDVITSRVTVFFKSNLVSKFEGGNLPNEKEYLALITNAKLEKRNETVESTEKNKKGGK
jgi:outer membrane protein assembly factor BamE